MRRTLFLRLWVSLLASTMAVLVVFFAAFTRYQPDPILQRLLRFWVVDSEGRVTGSSVDQGLPYSWDLLPHPSGALEAQRLEFEGRPSPDFVVVVALAGSPRQYLVWQRFLTNPLLLEILGQFGVPVAGACVAVCLAVLYLLSRRKSKEAAWVLSQLEHGNLKARFRVGRADEIGQLMLRFNEMADRIEGLVLKLRQTEESRRELLQQIAHDVKTPMTAIRFTLENLRDAAPEVPISDSQDEVLAAVQEMDYFERLIEDLFLLAKIEEPRFKDQAQPVDLAHLVAGEVEKVRSSHKAAPEKVDWVVESELGGDVLFPGDPFLLSRMIRNGLENAGRFARSKVTVLLKRDSSAIHILIRDDGTGFSEDALKHFGERRSVRYIDFSQRGRMSIGLGSVVLKAIATAYHGRLSVRNWVQAGGSSGGAEVSIELPLPASSAALRAG